MNNLDGTTPRTLEQAFGPRARLHIETPSAAAALARRIAAWAGRAAIVFILTLTALGLLNALASGVEVVL